MKDNSAIVRLTLCAPGDVIKELNIVSREIEEWNLHHWDATSHGIKLRHWLSDASPDLSDRPQGVINRQLIDEADIIIAIFWSRFGSPTGVAASGTEEEVRRAVLQKKRVLLYFSDLEPLPNDADFKQLEKLAAFREEMRSAGLVWNFRSRVELKAQFRRHLDQYMDQIIASKIKKGATKKEPMKIKQSGKNNTLIAGNDNKTTIYQSPPIIRQVVPPPPGSISASEQQQISSWIEALVEATVGKTRDEGFAMWWSRLKRKFKVSKYEHISSTDFLEIAQWYRQQLAIAKSQRRSKAPEQWRTDRIVAIKSAMGAMGRSKDDYYPALSDRLNMKRPFTSLTKLTKIDLERVYRLVLSDARKRQ